MLAWPRLAVRPERQENSKTLIRKLLAITAFTAAMALLSGCAGAPVQEMSDARQAISSAEKAGAQVRAADDLEQARKMLETADLRLEQGDYKGARASAVEAKMMATEAREKALFQDP